LAASVSFEKTLLTVFKEKDEECNGNVSLNEFTRILVNLGSTLNFDEISLIAERYKATEKYGNGRNSVSDFNGFYNSGVEDTKRNFSSSGKTHTQLYIRIHTLMHTYTYTYTYTVNHTCILMSLTLNPPFPPFPPFLPLPSYHSKTHTI
jgi:hypothetical protein